MTTRSRSRYPISNPRGPGYIVRWRSPEGTHRQRTFSSKRAAEAFHADLAFNRNRDASYDPAAGRITLADYWPTFFAGLESKEGRRPAPSTLALYSMHARVWVVDGQRLPAEDRLGPRRMNAMTSEHIRRWRNAMREAGAGEPTINAATRLLKSVMNRAVLDGKLHRSRPPRCATQRSTPTEA